MSRFGSLYSYYYDLLYESKDYNKEVEYVDGLIKEHHAEAKKILDMGCGTGQHASIFCDKNYTVHGIDLSEDMIKVAETKRVGRENKLKFSHTNIQKLKLKEKFDVVTSLFHVMSYQNSNSELIRTFEVAMNHLKKGGLFIFDFWYGPAVLTDLPSTKVKRLENDLIQVTRIAEPTLYPQQNLVDVNYEIFIKDRQTSEVINKMELHKMRYFFDTELELIVEDVGFTVKQKYKWISNMSPGFDSWNVVWVLKK